MARVPFLEYDEAPPEVRKIYDGQKAAAGKTLTTTRLRGHCPALLKGIAAMQASQGESGFAPGDLKPLITLLVSRLNECPHWVDIHSSRSLRAGHSEDKLRAILEYAAHPDFTPAERAALAYAEGMTKTPVDVSDEVFGALREHFDTPAIVEISVFAAYQNFNAKFNGALQADVNALCPVDLPGLG